ncbi:MAG: ABC transporter permease subunit [Clostridia bacterium]|nr:ABC transporter permease subunit [Clostridia bacterium]
MIKKKINFDSVTSLLYPLIFGVLILIMWQNGVLHTLFKTDEYILPYPTRIFQIISENSDKILENVASSVIVIIIGLILGSVLGYLAAIGATLSPGFGRGGLTVISAFNAIPIVAMAPVIMNWTKDVSSEASVRSMVAKIIVVTLMCMASMSINAHRGLTELKPFSLDLMKSYAADKKTVFMKLRLPNSIPYIFTALKVSVPSSVITALVSEYFAEYRTGVGRQIRENILIAQYATAWAYIVVACLIGIVLFMLLLAAESIFLKRRKH